MDFLYLCKYVLVSYMSCLLDFYLVATGAGYACDISLRPFGFHLSHHKHLLWRQSTRAHQCLT